MSLTAIQCAIADELLHHKWLVGLVGLYCVLSLGLGFVTGQEVDLFLYSSSFFLTLLGIAVGYVYWRGVKLAGKTGGRPFFLVLKEDVASRISLNQIVAIGLLFLMYSVFFSAFQSTKVMIPALNPFELDVTYAELDRQLHGGVLPHELLQPLLGYPIITFFIQGFYNIWFALMIVVLCWQMCDRSRPLLRMRFLMTFTLAWFVVGTLAAILMSSAGPVFFDRVTGYDGPYGGLLEYLRGVNEVYPIVALDMQEMLWTSYSTGALESGMGISAMPSLHVTISVLLFLFARHHSTWMAWALGINAVVIMLGSVHLGWHYAIDGYVGATLISLIWWGLGFSYGEEKRPLLNPALAAA